MPYTTTHDSVVLPDGQIVASWRAQPDPSCCGTILLDRFFQFGKLPLGSIDSALDKLCAAYPRKGLFSCVFMLNNKSIGHNDVPAIHKAFLKYGFREVVKWLNPTTGSTLVSLVYASREIGQ